MEARLSRFRYRAAAADGRVRSGTLLASSGDAAARVLAERGLTVLRVRQRRPLLPARRPSRHEVAVVFRNVATLVSSGVPIERALAASEPLVSPLLAASIVEVRRLIREGRPVGLAFGAQSDVFPPSVVGVIRAAERGGSLADACLSVAEQLEESALIRSRVQSALAYPTLVLLVGVVTVIVMGTVVIPRFAEILTDVGAELPPMTTGLLAASSLLERYGLLLGIILLVALPFGTAWLQAPGVRIRVDRCLLRMPLVGSIRLGFASARTCRALGAMLTSGMPLLAALDAAGDATGDLEVTRRLALAREAVARGATLTESLKSEKVLSEAAIQLVGVGETSSRLGTMVSRAAAVAGEQAERTLRTAVGLLEPALVVMMGVIVAAVAAALLQAVYSIRPIA